MVGRIGAKAGPAFKDGSFGENRSHFGDGRKNFSQAGGGGEFFGEAGLEGAAGDDATIFARSDIAVFGAENHARRGGNFSEGDHLAADGSGGGVGFNAGDFRGAPTGGDDGVARVDFFRFLRWHGAQRRRKVRFLDGRNESAGAARAGNGKGKGFGVGTNFRTCVFSGLQHESSENTRVQIGFVGNEKSGAGGWTEGGFEPAGFGKRDGARGNAGFGNCAEAMVAFGFSARAEEKFDGAGRMKAGGFAGGGGDGCVEGGIKTVAFAAESGHGG